MWSLFIVIAKPSRKKFAEFLKIYLNLMRKKISIIAPQNKNAYANI